MREPTQRGHQALNEAAPHWNVGGNALGDLHTRMRRLEEGLEVITRLIRSDEPASFDGQFYQVREARLLPRARRRTPILLGGNGPKRTLPLVARYADIWNGVGLAPALFAERCALLDELLRGQGRQPHDVRRTLMVPVLCWRNAQECEARLAQLRSSFSGYASLPADALLERLRAEDGSITGTPEEVIEQLRGYAAAGVEEVMMQWISLDDIEGITVLAEEVLPHFASEG